MVTINLKPYDAVSILAFCREFINADTPNDYNYSAIKEAVSSFESQLMDNLSEDNWKEIYFENELNQVIGKVPKKNKYKCYFTK